MISVLSCDSELADLSPEFVDNTFLLTLHGRLNHDLLLSSLPFDSMKGTGEKKLIRCTKGRERKKESDLFKLLL